MTSSNDKGAQQPAGRPSRGAGQQVQIKAVRGTRDLLPDQTPLWNRVETTARAAFARYGFGEIRTPVFEATELFARGVGEETDIVSKEMFTWEDRERFDVQRFRKAWHSRMSALRYFEVHEDVNFEGARLDVVGRRAGQIDGRYTQILELVQFKAEARRDDIDRLSAITARFPVKDGKQVAWGILAVPESRTSLRHELSLPENVKVEYLFGDFFQSSNRLTLRPESTAGVVRAYIEHKMGETGALQKLYYIGPQFRRERPQRGRYRQFWQIGAEVIGPPSSGAESPLRDAEVLEMLASLLDELGVRGWRLELNSVGNAEDRARFNTALREALAPVKDKLCPDNQRRAETNPLRVLDSKDEQDQEIINGLPKIADYLGEESREHFAQVRAALDACGVEYHVNPRLVRGLDYYTRTTFEFTVQTGLGTQNALLGGGRYDGLSEMLGGPKAPGIGFAIGEDRLILVLQEQANQDAEAAGAAVAEEKLDVYVAPLGVERNAAALALARGLRREGLSVEVGDGSFKLRKSFDVADKVARAIVLLGEDEVASSVMTVKTFATGEQVKVARAELTQRLRAR
jgi:histidyl-tRNA synthetase